MMVTLREETWITGRHLRPAGFRLVCLTYQLPAANEPARGKWGKPMAEVQTPAVRAASAGATLVVALCFAIAVLEGFDIQAMGVTASKIGPAYHLTKEAMGWILTASNIGLVIGASLGGWIADKIGRKPLLVGSVIVFGVFTFVTTLAFDYNSLFAIRLATGLGLGAAMPNLIAIASEISPPGKRASTTTLMFIGMPVGGASSALFVASLPHDFDWKLIFYIGGVLPLVLTPILMRMLPETRAAHEEKPANVIDALFGGGRAPASLLLWIAFIPTLLILYLMLGWLPTLVAGKGLTGPAPSQASLFFNVGSVFGGIILGRIVDKVGHRWPLTLSFVGLVGAMFALATATGYLPVMALSALVGMFCLGAQYALYGVAPQYYPPSVRGTGAGASVAMGRLGSIAGPLVAGSLLGAGKSATEVLQALVPVAAVAGAAVFLLTVLAKMRDD